MTSRRKHTIRLVGNVGERYLLILIESGSAHSFVTPALVSALKIPVIPTAPAKFTIANGEAMECTSKVPHLTWSVGEYVFTHEMHVLPMSYDLILGADWLELHSPMWIDWRRNLMKFTHLGHRIQLQGVLDNTSACPQISGKELLHLMKTGAISHSVQV